MLAAQNPGSLELDFRLVGLAWVFLVFFDTRGRSSPTIGLINGDGIFFSTPTIEASLLGIFSEKL